MDNIKLLEYSKKNPEPALDRHYMFIEKHKNLDLYVKKIKEIKELLIAIKKIKNKKEAKKVLEGLFGDLDKQLTGYANYSEFGCFINACDITMEDAKKDISVLKEVTFLYLDNRELNDIVPTEWIQALLDNNSSRQKGANGENKLIDILKKKGFKLTKSLEEFQKSRKAVARFSSGSKDFSNQAVNIKFGTNFGKKTQGKALDLIIKNGEDIYFLEAKHMNTGGGGQNQGILELIELIRMKPQKSNYHFVSFLDGIFFDKYFKETKKKKNKTQKQIKDIAKYLKKNKNNYFINTAGFEELFG
ncbi:hypothetical protein KJ885_04865 [Patescibacteria group bacterium]|nr:hypothetical protein [Patescibacteria group bacterium]